jgi:hypothetical protein
MSKLDSMLEQAARQWRDEVDAAYTGVALRPPTRARPAITWFWAGSAAAAAVAAIIAGSAISGRGADGDHNPARPAADCAGPTLKTPGGRQPQTVKPGQRLKVQGKYYVTGCQDSTNKAKPQPIHSVRLTLIEPAGHRVKLATAHPAGELGTFTVSVRIPRDTPRGRATLNDSGISSAAIKLVISPAHTP